MACRENQSGIINGRELCCVKYICDSAVGARYVNVCWRPRARREMKCHQRQRYVCAYENRRFRGVAISCAIIRALTAVSFGNRENFIVAIGTAYIAEISLSPRRGWPSLNALCRHRHRRQKAMTPVGPSRFGAKMPSWREGARASWQA